MKKILGLLFLLLLTSCASQLNNKVYVILTGDTGYIQSGSGSYYSLALTDNDNTTTKIIFTASYLPSDFECEEAVSFISTPEGYIEIEKLNNKQVAVTAIKYTDKQITLKVISPNYGSSSYPILITK